MHAQTMRYRGFEGFDVENESWECGVLRDLGGQDVHDCLVLPVPAYVQGWKKAADGGFQWS